MSAWWEQFAAAVRDDFSDLSDVAAFTRVTLRLLLAALLGGVLGYQREQVGKAAGLRTHMLVAIGAAMFVLIPLQMGAPASDVTRVIQGLTAGIGFLGAGAILKKGSDEANVQGLTTAAGIWLTAAIGTAAGMGRFWIALFCTGLAFVILLLLPQVFESNDPPGGAGGPPQQGGQDDPDHRVRV